MSELSDSTISPLDLIRNKEAEVTGQLAAARERAENEIARAREQALVRESHAEEQGRCEGEAQRQRTLEEVDQETKQIVADARAKVEVLRRMAPNQMEAAVNHVVTIVLGEATRVDQLSSEERHRNEA